MRKFTNGDNALIKRAALSYNQGLSIVSAHMSKTHLAIGVVVAAIVIVGIAASRSPELASNESNLAASAVANLGAASKLVVVLSSYSGFIPAVARVPRGGTVYFLNIGGKALRIAPVTPSQDASAPSYGFASSKSVKRGGSFALSVTTPGSWEYQNLNDPKTVGTIVVE